MAEELKVGAACFEKYEKLLQGKRVALVCNHTSRVGERMLYDTLRERGIKLVRLFTPEHGLEGIADAGERVRSSKSRKDFPEIVSLYDHNKRLPLDKLKGIDIVLFDLQDVGVRCYTYISTMHYVMEACAQSNVPFVVLDRPNPNGYFVDGTVLELKYKSFVGMHPVPWVHGVTVGEYATYRYSLRGVYASNALRTSCSAFSEPAQFAIDTTLSVARLFWGYYAERGAWYRLSLSGSRES